MTSDPYPNPEQREDAAESFQHCMKATLLTIGDELLIGQVVNTNAAWLGEQLNGLGVEVVRAVSLGDDEAAIRHELAQALASSDLVIVTGGLGPTHDDITREAVAGYFGVALREDRAILEALRKRFRRGGRVMAAINERVALVPEGFEPLANSVGSAPGLWWRGEAGGKTRIVVLVPGVPRELKALYHEEIIPRLRGQDALRVIVHRTLLTAGIGESNLQERLGDLSAYLGPQLRLASLPAAGSVRLRLTAMGTDRTALEAALGRLEAHLRARIGPHLYGTDEDTLEAALGRTLAERGLTIAVAESCTGGLVLHRLTNISGSSAYVVGGVVAYSNAVKRSALGVEAEALAQHGAVSEIVARQMARGVCAHLNADVGISTTGVAGPSGGTPEKPVGTVWTGYADAHGDRAQRHHFGQDRAMNKIRAATAALDLARRQLLAP